uniref:Uncharacterized protein n=1 Tax=Ixodes ricinus TaxID=34613 RepID=A0A147BQ84_IXORI
MCFFIRSCSSLFFFISSSHSKRSRSVMNGRSDRPCEFVPGSSTFVLSSTKSCVCVYCVSLMLFMTHSILSMKASTCGSI